MNYMFESQVGCLLLIMFLAYLIGSIPTGYILVKALRGIDIRKEGSGSTGATNVKRVLGPWSFFVVLTLDAIKGMTPVFIAKYIESKYGILADLNILPVLASISVIIGHSKSIFLGFTGGKSVASGAGAIFALNWMVGLACAAIFTSIGYFSKIISIASIITVCLTPLLMYLFKQPLSYIIYCAIGALYIIYLHRDNIKRLLEGNENKVRK